MSMGVQEFFQTFFTILLNRCLHTKPVFAILVKMGCFFVQFVYLHHKKWGFWNDFLEGYYTYKPKKNCYNMVSRTGNRMQNAKCRIKSNRIAAVRRQKQLSIVSTIYGPPSCFDNLQKGKRQWTKKRRRNIRPSWQVWCTDFLSAMRIAVRQAFKNLHVA